MRALTNDAYTFARESERLLYISIDMVQFTSFDDPLLMYARYGKPLRINV